MYGTYFTSGVKLWIRIIVDLAEKVLPKTPRIYKPVKTADKVLAIPSGFAQKYRIQTCDFVNYSD